jgi:hypothetical protein
LRCSSFSWNSSTAAASGAFAIRRGDLAELLQTLPGDGSTGIVIVDDDPSVLRALARLLHTRGLLREHAHFST